MISDKEARQYFGAVRESVRSREEDVEGRLEAEYHGTLERLSDCIQRYEAQKEELNEQFTAQLQKTIGEFSHEMQEMTEFSRKAGQQIGEEWQEIKPKMDALAEIRRILKSFSHRTHE